MWGEKTEPSPGRSPDSLCLKHSVVGAWTNDIQCPGTENLEDGARGSSWVIFQLQMEFFFRLRNSFLYLTSSFNEWYFTLSNYNEWHYFFLLHSSWWRVFNVFLMFVCGDNFNLFLLLGRHSLEKENTRWVLLRQANCPVGKLERYLKEK